MVPEMTPVGGDGQARRQGVDAGDQVGERLGVGVGAGDLDERRQRDVFIVGLVVGVDQQEGRSVTVKTRRST